jgi:serine/threonine-protein kinase HipA
MMNDARVLLWGVQIGAVSWLAEQALGYFQYTPELVEMGIQLSPIVMPLATSAYSFPALSRESFNGLPGLLADSLPDRFGNAIIDEWLVRQGRAKESFHPVERLCYMGRRGMGALEFEPALALAETESRRLELESLIEVVNRVLNERSSLSGRLGGDDDQQAMSDILRVGTSAGGARAKAVLAWNPATNEFRSGQIEAKAGFEQWLLKFDGVRNMDDDQVSVPLGYGRIEYAYYLMARKAGIEMSESRLHTEGGRSHFMTRRFDRTARGGKLHMQSLGALAHFDFRQPASYSYEQAIVVMKRLALPMKDLEQLVLRCFFNIVARNQDDHVKNIAFLMDQSGTWSLSPAYDLTYAWNPAGIWTARHQMSVNGKRSGFERDDLLQLAASAGIKRAAALRLLGRVKEAVSTWPECAGLAGIEDSPSIGRIGAAHRLKL